MRRPRPNTQQPNPYHHQGGYIRTTHTTNPLTSSYLMMRIQKSTSSSPWEGSGHRSRIHCYYQDRSGWCPSQDNGRRNRDSRSAGADWCYWHYGSSRWRPFRRGNSGHWQTEWLDRGTGRGPRRERYKGLVRIYYPLGCVKLLSQYRRHHIYNRTSFFQILYKSQLMEKDTRNNWKTQKRIYKHPTPIHSTNRLKWFPETIQT